MASDRRLMFLTTVACFQLFLCVSPASGLGSVDSEEDRKPAGVLQRWYLTNPSVHTPAAALTRYLIDEGIYTVSQKKTRHQTLAHNFAKH